jgi:hypothetical protein
MEIDDILDDCEVNRLPIFFKINNLEKKKKITSFIDWYYLLYFNT